MSLFGHQRPRGLLGGIPMDMPTQSPSYTQVPMSGQDITPHANPQMAMQGIGQSAAAMAPQPKRGGFNAPGGWAERLAMIGAVLNGHPEAPLQAIMTRREQEAKARAAAAERAASMEDWRTKFDYEQGHKVQQPGEFDQALIASGVQPGTPEWTKAHADRVAHWTDPFVNVSLSNGQIYSGPQSGLAAFLAGGQAAPMPKPVGKLTPIGGPMPQASGNFQAGR